MAKSFKEFYEEEKRKPVPAKAFISRMAKATKRREWTVRMWLGGRQVPDDLVKARLAQVLGVKAEDLFPESQSNINKDS